MIWRISRNGKLETFEMYINTKRTKALLICYEKKVTT